MATRSVEREQTVVPNASKFRDTAFWAFWVLRAAFFAMPIALGVEKVFARSVHWPGYIWAGWPDLLGTTPTQFVHAVGALEIVVGIVVLVSPRLGALLLTAWFGVVVANLATFSVTHGQYWDIAVRDMGLLAGAVSLFMLAWAYRPLRYVVHPHGRVTHARRTRRDRLQRAA